MSNAHNISTYSQPTTFTGERKWVQAAKDIFIGEIEILDFLRSVLNDSPKNFYSLEIKRLILSHQKSLNIYRELLNSVDADLSIRPESEYPKNWPSNKNGLSVLARLLDHEKKLLTVYKNSTLDCMPKDFYERHSFECLPRQHRNVQAVTRYLNLSFYV